MFSKIKICFEKLKCYQLVFTFLNIFKKIIFIGGGSLQPFYLTIF